MHRIWQTRFRISHTKKVWNYRYEHCGYIF